MKAKVALVHDWLTGMRGGERCLEVFCELFPEADLFTLVYQRGAVSPTIERMAIHPSFLQHIPQAPRIYRHLLPILPLAIRQFRLTGYDLILSSSHAVAKGVRRRDVPWHICYCFTPMRYIWDQSAVYFPRERFTLPSWVILQALFRYLRAWDVKNSRGVDAFIAISEHIAAKIGAYYNRTASVIPPPVDCEFFTPDRVLQNDGSPLYLIVSALVPYKRVDLAVAAFNRLQSPLVIIGVGPERQRLERLAGPHIRFLGWQPDDVVRDYYRRCRALIFPGEEDFGIVPLEAQACGKPVIAFGRGGALETIIPLDTAPGRDTSGLEPTGVFFYEPTIEALCETVLLFQRQTAAFNAKACRRNALRFDRPLFKARIKAFLAGMLGRDIE
ncbi:MAG TPA: glycosyltransferase [Alphaproteobacteria bacterium]|nr:glycosyltransferase [Alphaproteobacteria bacterium]